MKTGIYTRVSTDKQTVDNQIHKLREYARIRELTIVKIYKDVITGKEFKRQGLEDLKHDIKRGRIQAVLVYDVDRLGRSALDLMQIVDFFHKHNCNFISFNNAIDTTTPQGYFIFTINAAYAELEAKQISQRTKAAYARKRSHAEALGQRVKWGRKKEIFTEDEILFINEMIRLGFSWRKISESLNQNRSKENEISYSTVRRAFQNGGP